MANNNKVQIVTAKGEILYPKIRQTETFNGEDTGKYVVSIKLSKEETDKLIARLEDEWEAAKQSPEFRNKTFKKGTEPNLGYREDKDGDIVFKAKTSAVIKTKKGETIEREVPVFDAKGKPIKDDIGHGSIGRLSITPAPYHTASNNYGLVLYLNGIQIVDLKPPGSFNSAESLGFGEEDGYTVEDPAADMGFPPDDKEEF